MIRRYMTPGFVDAMVDRDTHKGTIARAFLQAGPLLDLARRVCESKLRHLIPEGRVAMAMGRGSQAVRQSGFETRATWKRCALEPRHRPRLLSSWLLDSGVAPIGPDLLPPLPGG